MKRAGGRRFYRPQDLDMLRGVRTLLHDEGYTIKGVQKLHREGGLTRLLKACAVASAAIVHASAATDALELAPLDPPDLDAPDERQIDLFAAPPAQAPAEREDHPVLDRHARERLAAVLDDLEGVRARIDALLARPAPG